MHNQDEKGLAYVRTAEAQASAAADSAHQRLTRSVRPPMARGLLRRQLAGKGDVVVDFLHVIAIAEHAL
jgi:hypothetical protein